MSEIESNAPEEATALQDLLAGGIAGSCSVVVGHPFDTYKVRLQTSSSRPSVGSISSLFKGMGPPLSTAAVVNALIFSSFGESSRLWDDFFYPEEGHHVIVKDVPNHEHKHGYVEPTIPPEHSSWQKSLVCGSLAGAVQALVICPSEHIKCRIQVQSTVQHAQFKGPLEVASTILNGYGLGGLYRGFACTCWREIPAFGLYFATYDYVKEQVTEKIASKFIHASERVEGEAITMQSHPSIAWTASILSGGFSGAFTWAIIYPFDVIKTKIQTSPLDTPLKERRISYMYRNIVENHGFKHLFRGLGVTVFRAFPVNAIIFPVYEFTLMHLVEKRYLLF